MPSFGTLNPECGSRRRWRSRSRRDSTYEQEGAPRHGGYLPFFFVHVYHSRFARSFGSAVFWSRPSSRFSPSREKTGRTCRSHAPVVGIRRKYLFSNMLGYDDGSRGGYRPLGAPDAPIYSNRYGAIPSRSCSRVSKGVSGPCRGQAEGRSASPGGAATHHPVGWRAQIAQG